MEDLSGLLDGLHEGKLGPDWTKAEAAKTSEQQHPLMQCSCLNIKKR
jgi:hypothetical protein